MGLPIDHLSASSINKFLRCPRQWQNHYIFGEKGPAGSALVIGSAVHLALSRRLKGEDEGAYWAETVAEYEDGVIWDDPMTDAHETAQRMIKYYWEQVGRFLQGAVVSTEQEYNLKIPGVEIPVVGFIDLETKDRIIDYKTTRYFAPSRVKLNKEWKLQQAIYQLVVDKPGEIHVLTRARSPIVIPTTTDHVLYIGHTDKAATHKIIRDEWHRMNFYWENYGENVPWPGNPLHDWAGKYCPLKGAGCCEL